MNGDGVAEADIHGHYDHTGSINFSAAMAADYSMPSIATSQSSSMSVSLHHHPPSPHSHIPIQVQHPHPHHSTASAALSLSSIQHGNSADDYTSSLGMLQHHPDPDDTTDTSGFPQHNDNLDHFVTLKADALLQLSDSEQTLSLSTSESSA
jgi:hypothetical protein